MDNKDKCNINGCHDSELKRVCSTAARLRVIDELNGWQFLEEHLCPLCGDYACPVQDSQLYNRLSKKYSFESFTDALEFVNAVGAIANEMNHHPNIQLKWGSVDIEIWTHSVNDLTDLDFTLAAKIECIKAHA